MPGGDTRASAHYAPFPLAMVEGKGCRLNDVDGHQFLDFMNNFTSLVHGHAHGPTVAAVREQVARGSAFAAPSESQVALASLLVERVPSLDELRFTSSGTEATSMALRAARAFTGRPRFLKVEGGYHGSHELGETSLIPLPGKAGPRDRPETLALDRSFSQRGLEEVVATPFNHPDVTRAQLAEHRDQVAALIVEPVLGSMGMLPAEPGYLAALRELCDEFEVLLVFDEVVTLRLGTGGVQGRIGVTPDLTCMGKIIGGGLPVGAFGGRRDVLEQFNPDRRDAIFHASTFSGNALTMAAGLAALSDLHAADIERIDALGGRLRAGMNAAFARAGIRGQATGQGSLAQVHWTDRPLRDARDALAGMSEARGVPATFQLCLLRRGLFAAARGMFCVSTAMTEAEIDAALAAFEQALGDVRPLLEEAYPHLLTR
jgi:glutamate-1-semialdehyde 2,1-aminomutase